MEDRTVERIRQAVDEKRLVDTAIALVEIPSPTLSAGAVADRLAGLLEADGFAVERPVADWPDAPAVVARLDTGKPGPVLQFDGHLDTVHLPFVPPRHENGYLYGSGASDMKGGVAACVEALRVLRDTGSLRAGGVLLTAHDHHEGPWGDRRQLRALIRDGYTGDAVLLPEYLADPVPVAGRGMLIFDLRIERDGEPVHEVLRELGTPDVVGTGARLVARLLDLHERVKEISRPHAGHDSVFVGRIETGEIYNQSPTQCIVQGTRRWVTPGSGETVRAELQEIFDDVAVTSGTRIEVDISMQADAYSIETDAPFFSAFTSAHEACVGRPPVPGGKPFVDDGNTFCALAGIPALTHGPAATGAHTLQERCRVSELVRVATLYALTAVEFCS